MKHYLLTNFVYLLEGKNKHQKQVYRNSVVATAKILTWRFFCFFWPRTFILMTEFCPCPVMNMMFFIFLAGWNRGTVHASDPDHLQRPGKAPDDVHQNGKGRVLSGHGVVWRRQAEEWGVQHHRAQWWGSRTTHTEKWTENTLIGTYTQKHTGGWLPEADIYHYYWLFDIALFSILRQTHDCYCWLFDIALFSTLWQTYDCYYWLFDIALFSTLQQIHDCYYWLFDIALFSTLWQTHDCYYWLFDIALFSTLHSLADSRLLLLIIWYSPLLQSPADPWLHLPCFWYIVGYFSISIIH